MVYIFPFLLGMTLSALGQLPLGTISLTATQISLQESFRRAWQYSLGIALVEMVYLRLVLAGMHWITAHQSVFNIFNWLAVLFFLLFGILSFISARKQDKHGQKALILNNHMHRFLLGVSMSGLNPAQIPFWFIWSAYFLNIGWLRPDPNSFNLFTVGSGLGTLLGLVIYMYGGNWMIKRMKTSSRTLNTVIGMIFILAALIQLGRLLWF
jgi:threonine/homoserine/homoserine lactone efflux protein